MNTEIHEDSRTQRRRTRSQDLLAELDEMLADIDEVLAGINAQEFVDNYVQEGGE